MCKNCKKGVKVYTIRLSKYQRYDFVFFTILSGKGPVEQTKTI